MKECENCTRPAEYQVQAYRFCLACARRFLGYTPGDEMKIVSLPTAPVEETQLDLALVELTDLRTTLERQSAEMARIRAELTQARAQIKSTDFARTRAEEALRRIRAYTQDRYIIACIEQGLGGVNG